MDDTRNRLSLAASMLYGTAPPPGIEEYRFESPDPNTLHVHLGSKRVVLHRTR
jgi:hypothetical protein